ncbi:FUSC family protein [Klebsiella sp. BIGb0407]|uniref:FUSC family protein n=1 Tax=Klebsiella sp. BIGb0407 TaxID=2940603 RepID=UPI002169CDCB|nr:FUSC family protein [Klebsiella sp. BIGb0407]MCS3429802.1 hypothetical protein [Klebsiella sp. BIGb0407]
MTSITPEKIRRAALLAIGVMLPWFIGIISGYAQYGSIASFASYLMVVSFPLLPASRCLPVLAISALLFSVFASIGVFVTLGSVSFFIFALLAALAQGLGELKQGYFRLPIALSALTFFLSVGQVPASGPAFYSLCFSVGAVWGIVLARVMLPVNSQTEASPSLQISPLSLRFAAGMGIVSLVGSVLACLSGGSHPCWLPAAALRVMKPTREQTIYRIKTRSIGTLAGAATGGLLLGLSPVPWLHAFIAGGMLFAMLLIGAKRYGGWSFCLTAIALAFNLAPDASAVSMALNRSLLTIIGMCLAVLALLILVRNSSAPSKPQVPD